jgi:hypothetical protein
VDRAKTPPAAAATRLPVTRTIAASPKAAITWNRNSHPITCTFRKPVRYRSQWIAPVAVSSPAPATRSPSLSQRPGATSTVVVVAGVPTLVIPVPTCVTARRFSPIKNCQ